MKPAAGPQGSAQRLRGGGRARRAFSCSSLCQLGGQLGGRQALRGSSETRRSAEWNPSGTACQALIDRAGRRQAEGEIHAMPMHRHSPDANPVTSHKHDLGGQHAAAPAEQHGLQHAPHAGTHHPHGHHSHSGGHNAHQPGQAEPGRGAAVTTHAAASALFDLGTAYDLAALLSNPGLALPRQEQAQHQQQQAQQQVQQAAQRSKAPGMVPAEAAAKAAQVAADAAAAEDAAVAAAGVAREYTLVSPNWQPLIGVSRQHQKLVGQVQRAAADATQPLVISGEAGLKTLALAARVHAQGLPAKAASQPLVVVDCSSFGGQRQAAQLLSSRAADEALDSDEGLVLTVLQGGSLVLDNAHMAPPKLLQLMDAACRTLLGAPQPAGGNSAGQLLQQLGTRLVLVTHKPMSQLEAQLAALHGGDAGADGAGAPLFAPSLHSCATISVPPLRSRPSDIVVLATRAGKAAAELRGFAGVSLTDSAVRALSAYDFPGNEAELDGLVQRAINVHAKRAAKAEAAGRPDTTQMCVLTAEDFWGATQESERGRVDLLEAFPFLRPLLLDSGLWPHGVTRLVKVMFPLVVASLLFGPQDREHSAALTVFWAGWWPITTLSCLFVGRSWCSICPFMLSGEGAQELVQKTAAAKAGAAPQPKSAAGGCGNCSGACGGADRKHKHKPAAAGASAACTGACVDGGSCNCGGAPAAPASGLAGIASHLSRLAGHWDFSLRKWPNEQMAKYGGWFLLASFAGILLWEEVCDLQNNAYFSGWLLLLISAGAVVCSITHEKRLWCRHLCPVGGMTSLFAKLSMTEIAARKGLCASSACARPCHSGRVVEPAPWAPSTSRPAQPAYKAAKPAASAGTGAGGAAPVLPPRPAPVPAAPAHAAKALPGCPLNTHPGADQHACIMCGNCVRSCASSSATWRLRPPGVELWSDHSASWAELSLMYLLLGAVVLHRLPELCDQLGLPRELLIAQTGPHLLASAVILAAPGGAAWLYDRLAPAAIAHLSQRAATASAAARSPATTLAAVLTGRAPQPQPAAAPANGGARVSCLRISYSLLPLVWSGTLAHYCSPMMTELGQTLPRLATSLGFAADSALVRALPAASAPEAVVCFTQGATLLVGGLLSFLLAGQIGAVDVGRTAAGRAVLPARLLIVAATAELWRLIV